MVKKLSNTFLIRKEGQESWGPVLLNPDAPLGWILIGVVSNKDQWIISNEISVTSSHFVAYSEISLGKNSKFNALSRTSCRLNRAKGKIRFKKTGSMH